MYNIEIESIEELQRYKGYLAIIVWYFLDTAVKGLVISLKMFR